MGLSAEYIAANSSSIAPQRTLNCDGLPLIDRSVLNGFRPSGDKLEMQNRLNQLILKHGTESLDQLCAAMEDNDSKAIVHVAHRWRGSCLSFGFLRLAIELQELEFPRTSAGSLVDLLAIKMPILRAVFAASCDALKET